MDCATALHLTLKAIHFDGVKSTMKSRLGWCTDLLQVGSATRAVISGGASGLVLGIPGGGGCGVCSQALIARQLSISITEVIMNQESLTGSGLGL